MNGLSKAGDTRFVIDQLSERPPAKTGRKDLFDAYWLIDELVKT